MILSRDEILEFLISEFQKQFPDIELDLSQSNILNWFMKSVAILDESIFAYLHLIRNESILSTAIYPSSILNHAANLGISRGKAQPASGYLTLTIPLPSDKLQLILDPFQTQFVYNDIIFTPAYRYEIQVDTKLNLIVGYKTDFLGRKQLFPVKLTQIIQDNVIKDAIQFTIEIQNVIWKYTTSVVGVKESDYLYYDFEFPKSSIIEDGYQLSNTIVIVNNDEIAIESLTPIKNRYCYKILQKDSKLIIRFLPPLLGAKSIQTGQKVEFLFGITNGSKGNIPENSLTIESLTDVNGLQVFPILSHPAFNNGKDEETISDLRDRCLQYLKTKDLILSEQDLYNYLALSQQIYLKLKPFSLVNTVYANTVETHCALINPETNLPYLTSSVKLVLSADNLRLKVGSKFSRSQYFETTNTIDLRIESDDEDFIWQLPFALEIDTEKGIVNAFYQLADKKLDTVILYQEKVNDFYLQPQDYEIRWDPELDKYIITLKVLLSEDIDLNSLDYTTYFQYANQLYKIKFAKYVYDAGKEYDTSLQYDGVSIEVDNQEENYFYSLTKSETQYEYDNGILTIQHIVDPEVITEGKPIIIKTVFYYQDKQILKIVSEKSVVIKEKIPFFTFVLDAKKEITPIYLQVSDDKIQFQYISDLLQFIEIDNNTNLLVRVNDKDYATIYDANIQDNVIQTPFGDFQVVYGLQTLSGIKTTAIKILNDSAIEINSKQYHLQKDSNGYIVSVKDSNDSVVIDCEDKTFKLEVDNDNYIFTIDSNVKLLLQTDSNGQVLQIKDYSTNELLAYYDFETMQYKINYQRDKVNHYILYKTPVVEANYSLLTIQNMIEYLYSIYDGIRMKIPPSMNLNFVFAKTYGFLTNMIYNQYLDINYSILPFELKLPYKLKITFKAKPGVDPAEVKQNIKNSMLNWINQNMYFLDDISITTSKIEQYLFNNVDNLDFVKVEFQMSNGNYTDKSLVYNIDISSLSLEEKLQFVYEFIWFDPNFIEIVSV